MTSAPFMAVGSPGYYEGHHRPDRAGGAIASTVRRSSPDSIPSASPFRYDARIGAAVPQSCIAGA
jgi:hypothetical protein